MYQKDKSIIQRSNIQCDVVVINQCDKDSVEEFDFINSRGEKCKAIFVSSSERGLSKSRNLAIKYASGDICIICDDDQVYVENFIDIVNDAYITIPEASVMLFALNWESRSKKYSEKIQKLSYKTILQSNSPQITFRRKDIIENGLCFDEKMGSGTGNGGGEENKFLLDCKRKGLKLRYYPQIISTIKTSSSHWFKGFTPEYVKNLGWSSRRSQGHVLGLLYSLYWITTKYSKYKNNMNYLSAMKYILQGYISKR